MYAALVYVVLIIGMTPIFLYYGVRPRLHDLGHGGIWALLMFVPFVNVGMYLLLLFQAGKAPSTLYQTIAIHEIEESEADWECPQCHENNPNTTYVCSHCESSLV